MSWALFRNVEWDSAFFKSSLIIEGATEKVSQIEIPLKGKYIKMLYFGDKYVLLSKAGRLK
jgi:hypothetical protein